MAQKALKKKTLDSPRSTTSDGHKSKRGFSFIFPMKKFIALPDGLRVKSSDSEAILKKATPLRAVPLSTGGAQVETLSDQQQSPTLEGNNETQALTIATTHERLLNSSLGKGKQRYIKRSRSSPSDLGRKRLPGHRVVYRIQSSEDRDWFDDVDTDLANLSQVDLNVSLSSSKSINSTDFSNVNVSTSSRDKQHIHEYTDIPGGKKYATHFNYASLQLNGRVSRSLNELNNMEISRTPAKAYTNGTLPHNQKGLLVYKPSSEVIMLGNGSHSVAVPVEHNGYDSRQATLLKSRGHFSSMPSLLRKNSKEEKKNLKELKRREKEERKLREKEEKRRAKEEKKRQKHDKYIRTLPRNWGYINKPIESVYMRPRLAMTAVPIDFEDGPPHPVSSYIPPPPSGPPPMPPQPSLRTRSIYCSAPDLLRVEEVYGATLSRIPKVVYKETSTKGVHGKKGHTSIPSREYEARTVLLHKGPEGYGFVLRGAKAEARKGELDFHPSAEFPALQYLDSVDPGSKSDKAGLKGGDFILEINGENVIRASHDNVVHLIRSSGETLALKVVTVKHVNRLQDWFIHEDGCMTVPSRKKAPEPPHRDPHTSLSYSKAKSKSLTNGLEDIEKIEQTIEDADGHTKKAEEQRTASIKARHSAKRVSCVELENIGVYDQDNAIISNNEKTKPVVAMPKDYMSPSELRIKKYHKKDHGSLESANSTPDLQDNMQGETLYATPIINSSNGPAPDYPGSQTHVYAVPSDTNQKLWVVSRSASSASSRPGGLPPLPPDSPMGSSLTPTPKRQAPAPPGVEKTEVVTISRKRGSIHSNSSSELPVMDIAPPMMEESPYESSFRPGTNAKLTNESVSVTNSHKRNLSAGRAQSRSEGLILVTADVHVSDNKKGQQNDSVFEPEPVPDYDSDTGGERHLNTMLSTQKLPSTPDNAQVTVISIANDGRRESLNKAEEYQRRTDVLAQITKLNSPQEVHATHYGVSNLSQKKASPGEHARKHSYERFGLDTLRKSIDIVSSVSTVCVDSEKLDSPKSVAPPPPPIPLSPPPPPVTPIPYPGSVPRCSQLDAPKPPKTSPIRVETDSILAAVQARKARIEADGPRMIETNPHVRQDSWKQKMESNQAAILAAVAKRRSILEKTANNSVIESIESRLQKTKKLQSAKYYFSSDNISAGKEKSTVPKMESAKTDSTVSSSDISKNKMQSREVSVNSTKPKETNTISTPRKPETSTISTPRKLENINLEQKVQTAVPKNMPVGSSPKNMTLVANKSTDKFKGTTADSAVETLKKSSDSKLSVCEVAIGVKPVQEHSDFLAMAEKARQEYLKKKSSESLTSSKSSLESSKTARVDNSKKTDEKDVKDSKSVLTTKTMKDSRIISSTTPIKDRIQILEKNKLSQDGPKDVLQSQQTKNPSKTPGESKFSMKAASPKLSHTNVNGDISSQRSLVDGSLPPPPGFGDNNTVPPPTHFDLDHIGTDAQQFSMTFMPEDSESLVSSLSTMSTASSEHGDMWHIKHGNSFEDLIAPPPPGFDDKNNNHIDNIAVVIPPPPEFGDISSKIGQKGTKNFDSKPVDLWLCSDVLDWLDSLKMSQYKSRFQQQCIHGKKLIGLSRNDYIELGVTQVGHRMSLERSIKKASLFNNSKITYVEKL